MKLRPALLLIALLFVLAPALSGCVISREMTRVKRDVERWNPGLQLSRSLVLNLGGGSIHIAETVLDRLDSDRAMLSASFLHDIDRIQIGIYDAEWNGELTDVDLDNLSRFRGGGWERALAVRDQEAVTHVLYKPHGRSVRDLYLVSFQDRQLVAIRLRGNVERIVMKALEQRNEHDVFSIASIRRILEP